MQKERITEAEAEKASAFAISQEEIDAVLIRGSLYSQGKYRIYEQYLRKEDKSANIAFLKNEYGIGGAYPANRSGNRDLDESHDGKGIRIRTGFQTEPQAEIHLTWAKVEKRISELIEADRYLSRAEKESYPQYCAERELHQARSQVAMEFRSVVYDYNDYLEQLGEKEKQLNLYDLSGCWGAFSNGEKLFYGRTSAGDFILPMMRHAMNTIIADNTHLTERCKAVLDALNGPLAAPMEPTDAEMNPPPPPPKEYRFTLGDTVYLGMQEYELLSMDNEEVVLFDPEFPLFNKTMSRSDFDERVKENLRNNSYLIAVQAPAAEWEQPGDDPFEGLTDEQIDTLPVSVVENGRIVTYPNSEAMLNAQDTSGTPATALDKVTDQINRYCQKEFGTDADFTDPRKVDLAFTTSEDGNDTFQVSVNLVENKLLLYANQVQVGTVQCHDAEDLSEYLDGIHIDDLISLAEDEYEKSRSKENKEAEEPNEQDLELPAPPPPVMPKQGHAAPHILLPEIHSEQRSNFKIESDTLGVGTPMQRYTHNIAAIRLLHKLEEENRLASPEEQGVLANYVGWGGLPQFFEPTNPHFSELRSLLSEEEYAAARESTLTAFYTPPVVIRSMYAALENMGFQTGNILDMAVA